VSFGCKQEGSQLGQVFVGVMKVLRVVRVNSVWQSSSYEALECQQELVSGHISAYLQMDSTCSGACEESNITLSDVAPHLDIRGSCEVNSCDLEGFLGLYPVSGKWSFSLLTTGGFLPSYMEDICAAPS